jgi:hypothetical protein
MSFILGGNMIKQPTPPAPTSPHFKGWCYVSFAEHYYYLECRLSYGYFQLQVLT